ncbi:MAG: trimeric intracellular cation channel family protein [Gordonia sp. (in: high G+C Gram-positive bacteria)]|uniref:trimeric intracellular cation channel family protein n=1 Tax=Gordonia TaxID=2053 RepID=UPI003265BDF9
MALALVSEFDSAISLVHRVGETLGVAAFAASGALQAVRHNLDIVGILLLAGATALGGGIIRDLIMGRTPPIAFTDLQYVGVALAVGLIVFVWSPPARLTSWPLHVSDAIGLGMFAVLGTVAAFDWGLAAPSAAMLGLTTAIGGGIIRDVLSGEIPAVLRPQQHLYAIPSAVGAGVTALLLDLGWYRPWAGLLCVVLVTAFRLASLRFEWHGPRPWYSKRQGRSDD